MEVGGTKYNTGPIWSPRVREITYSFNDIEIPSDWREEKLGAPLDDHKRGLVREAMDAWERVSGVRFVEVADGVAARVRIGWADPSTSDGRGGQLAFAASTSLPISESVSYFGKVVVAFDIEERTYWDSDTNFYDAALHELGHAMGIGHSDKQRTVMSGDPESPYWNQPGRDQLTTDDIAAARSLWGLPGGGVERHGTPGNDHLVGTPGDDILHGHDGDDTLLGGEGNDTLLGGDGNDYLDGLTGDDHLDGLTGDDTLFGAAGNDTLFGAAGNDSLFGGQDHDTFVFGLGHGDDTIADFTNSSHGQDRIDVSALGLVDFDDLRATAVAGGVLLDLSDGGGGTVLLEGHTLGGLVATDFVFWEAADDDTVTTDDVDETVGTSGDDSLFGGAGNDSIHGGEDGDRIWGAAGDDTIDGGGGNDAIWGLFGNDAIEGGAGNDTLVGHLGDDRLHGGAGNDRLVGSAGNDILVGHFGDDRLYGGTGDDRLSGGAGNDTLVAQAGDDRLAGGGGDDRLWGGGGSDGFVFWGANGNDTVVDFTDGEDLIDLSAYDLSGYSDVSASQVGNHVRIDLSAHDGGTIMLRNFDIADLDAGDFLF